MRRLTWFSAAVVVLIGAASLPALAAAPFPTGDDGLRYRVAVGGATCGTNITTSSVLFHRENLPASGVTFYVRSYDQGVRESEIGWFVPPEGTGTETLPGRDFGPGTYPRSVGLTVRLDVGPESTYLGGTTITCSAQGATPVVTEHEDFFPPCGVGDDAPFNDVSGTSPFCDDISWAVELAITTGYADGGYHPGDLVTRQAMAAFIYRAKGALPLTRPCAAAPFLDVPATHPFCPEITWIADVGIGGGYPDGTFQPTANVSRQAMAAFLYRMEGEPNGPSPSCTGPAPFVDVPVSHPFCGELAWLADTGVTGGYPDGTYRPSAVVSRQAMAAFFHRRSLIP